MHPGDNTVELTATASSKLPVVYELLAGQDVVELTAATLRILAAGEFTVRAVQPGDEEYNPASATRVVAIDKFPQEITWKQSFAGVAYGDVITLVAESTSGLDIVYQITDGSATVAENALTITRPGTITVVATQSGDALYLPADPVVQTLVAGKASLLSIADGKSGRVGQPIPELTVSYEGLRLGDAPAIIDVPPTAYTSATAESRTRGPGNPHEEALPWELGFRPPQQ